MSKPKKILAWHFTDGMKLRDGTPLEVGKTYQYKGKIKVCESGYHASRQLIDALQYAQGAQISRVECWGGVTEQDDKLVARNRTVLWTIDATMILHEFACRVAEIALSKVENPDPCSIAAIEAKRKWMRGEITNKELYAAWHAAWGAIQAATLAAALVAAWAAAQSAERAAAQSAARGATREAAWDKLNTLLEEMVNKAHKEAAV